MPIPPYPHDLPLLLRWAATYLPLTIALEHEHEHQRPRTLPRDGALFGVVSFHNQNHSRGQDCPSDPHLVRQVREPAM